LEAIKAALTSVQQRRLNMRYPAKSGLLPGRRGSGLFGRRHWGLKPRGSGFCDWDGRVLPDDYRQIQGAFWFAHFRTATGFTPGAGKRARAQYPSQSRPRDMAAERRSPFGFG